MSDVEQDATLETEDSATTQDVDWQKRFTDTQAEYTKQQQALKDEQSVWEDEQALLSRISEKYPHLIADEETDDDEFDDDSSDEPETLTKAEFKAWQDEQTQAQQAKEAVQQFNDDLTRFVDDRELDQYGEAWIKSQSYKGPEDLEQAVNAWFEHLDSLGSPKRKRKAAHVVPGGKTVTGVPNYDDMTPDQINQAMVERARALDTQI